MVYAETLLSYPYWKIIFALHTNSSDKPLGVVISHNNKPIEFLSIILRNPQSNYTTTKKEPLVVVKFLNKTRGIIYGYEINLFSYHNNLVYAATLS